MINLLAGHKVIRYQLNELGPIRTCTICTCTVKVLVLTGLNHRPLLKGKVPNLKMLDQENNVTAAD